MTETYHQLFNLEGKSALVTGASRGIGESIAKCLAAYGAKVIVSSRKAEGCDRVVNEIIDSGGEAVSMPCHIGDLEAMTALFESIQSTEGKLDILVNNAAANPYFGHIVDTPIEAFQKTVDVNIRGYFVMTQLAAKMMREQKAGAIVNVASVNGIIPGGAQGIYSVTKAAVISLTKAFAKECASEGIRVNALLPGATDTKFASALVNNPDLLKQIMMHVPMRRVAQPDEMSAAVLYLASDASSYTTGTCLTVDGGYLLA